MYDKDIVIFKFSVAKDLIKQGYRVVNITRNRNNYNEIVFFFERTVELENKLEIEYNIKG